MPSRKAQCAEPVQDGLVETIGLTSLLMGTPLEQSAHLSGYRIDMQRVVVATEPVQICLVRAYHKKGNTTPRMQGGLYSYVRP